ncbi:amidohydrolase [Ramlibacter sp. AW1]|uniref:2-amino-3-carboxymuconate-6-semialdehyde decarboxylase n=1 Tax=Ramlibacter aurantiacus TaxID=2801330 RepID=A0A936ZIT8_9BURK|nr:amidohydrolase [Ramlibacter aurantiacus]
MSHVHPAACGCGIDAHAHVVPEHFPAYIGSAMPADWPSMAAASQPCHRNVMISGKVYRTVSDRCWDVGRRLADLPAMGLDLQVVSPMPELLSYWMRPADGQQLQRFLNDSIAAMVAESGGQLAGMGAVPLQDVQLAIRELEYVVRSLGFAAVEVGSNINGRPIGAPEFDPFFEACEALDAAVFVHAIRPAGMDRLLGPPALQQVLGYPGDVGLAAASVITGNLLPRRPGLRIAFSHGGGTLASLLPRLQQGWDVFPALKEQLRQAPLEQARRLFYDTLVFDAATLSHGVATFGASQLMIGSDYPFNFHEPRPVDRIAACGFEPEVARQLVRGNAERFLGMAKV